MSLTVPRAGTDAGRAPRIRVEAPQTGNAIAQFGQQVQETFQRVENFQLDTQLQKAEVDATRQLNDLRLEVEQIGDPSAAEARWMEGSQAIRGAYVGDTGSLPGKAQERFGLAFDRMNNAHAFSLGKRFISERFAEREANWVTYAHEATRAGATADPELRDALIAQGEDQIDSLVAANIIDADEAARRKIALRGDIDNARAIEMVESDPDGFLAATDDPDAFPGLSAEQRAAKRTQAQNAIDTREAANSKVAEREREAAISDFIHARQEGRDYEDPDFLSRPDIMASPNYAQAIAADKLAAELPAFRRLPPERREEVISEEAAKPVGEDWETERLSMLRAAHAEEEKKWRLDPVSAAPVTGVKITPLPDNMAANLGHVASILNRRRNVEMPAIVEMGHQTSGRILSNDERTAVAALISPDRSPDERAQAAQVLSQVLPEDGPDAFSELLPDDRAMQYVGNLLSDGGDRNLATSILRGRAEIAAGNVKMPPDAERLDATFGSIGTLFAGQSKGAVGEARLRAATDGLYAQMMKEKGPVEEFDAETYVAALHRAMGGVGAPDSRNAQGGVITLDLGVGNVPVAVPQGLSHGSLEDAVSRLGRRFEKEDVARMTAGQFPGSNPEALRSQQRAAATQGNSEGDGFGVRDNAILQGQLAIASLSGQPPAFGDTEFRWADLDRSFIQAIGDDRYRIVYPAAGGLAQIAGKDGKPFVFSMSRLVREVLK